MQKKLQWKQNLIIGLLLFGLLFGAGNLIFPVKLGQQSGSAYLVTSVGLILTAVGLPILGIISFALSKKETLQEYASVASPVFGLFFTVALFLTIGPLFAIPRTAMTAFEVGFGPALADNEHLHHYLLLFSLLFFSGVLFFALKPSRILDVVGKSLSPVLLVLLAILFVSTVISPMGTIQDYAPVGNFATNAPVAGAIEGYNTMDAIAVLAFGIIIVTNIRSMGVTDPGQTAVDVAKSSLFTILFLSVIYIALAYIGASSNGIMAKQENGGLILSITAKHIFGVWGLVLLAATVTVACFKTAIGLVVSIAETFVEVFHHKVSYPSLAIGSTLISFVVANFGLNTIIAWSTPVLMFLYPLAITQILLWILHHFVPLRPLAFQITLVFASIPALFDGLNALPKVAKATPLVTSLVHFAKSYLPLFSLGMSWVLPVAIGVILSLLIARRSSKYPERPLP